MNLLYRREGFPEEGELVLCKVLSVNPHSSFVNLEEYDKQGLIHISEISPGRIRNIYEYVKPGKIIVCKVLRVNKERGHIDLSLRRVTQLQHRKKIEEIKEEQNAEKIVEFFASKQKKDFKKLYHEIAKPILKEYTYLFECFDDVVKDKVKLEDLGVRKEIAEPLTELIKQRRKPKKVSIKGLLKLTSYKPNGVDVVKEAIRKGLNVSKSISIKYAGSGAYFTVITADDYKEAERILKKFLEVIESHMKETDGEFSFERKKEK